MACEQVYLLYLDVQDLIEKGVQPHRHGGRAVLGRSCCTSRWRLAPPSVLPSVDAAALTDTSHASGNLSLILSFPVFRIRESWNLSARECLRDDFI